MFINKYSQAHLILRPRELERTYLLTHVTLRWSTSSTRYSRRSRRSARCTRRMPICADGSTRRSAGPTRCAGTSSPTSSGAIRRDLARSGSSRRISANIRRSQVRVRRLGCGQLLRRGVVHRRPAHLRVELVLAGAECCACCGGGTGARRRRMLRLLLWWNWCSQVPNAALVVVLELVLAGADCCACCCGGIGARRRRLLRLLLLWNWCSQAPNARS